MKINLRNLCGLASATRRQTILDPFNNPAPKTRREAAQASLSLTYGRTTPAWMGGLDWTEKRKRKHQSLLSRPAQSTRLDHSNSGKEIRA
jgi:hypothetical protein